MIKLENTQVSGFEPAIRGMRNPMNSWDKSDSAFEDVFEDRENFRTLYSPGVDVGSNDHDLMTRLNAGGSEHSKYRRMIVVYVDITAPLYWWKEMDTYKVGTVANSCSTMHKIAAKEFTLDDFSCEHLFAEPDNLPAFSSDKEEIDWHLENGAYDAYPVVTEMFDEIKADYAKDILLTVIRALNAYRDLYLETKDKRYWWQMIQLLPTSYNQKRTLMLNYEVLASIYRQRKGHKLDEWHAFREWIESLPYSELITGEREKAE